MIMFTLSDNFSKDNNSKNQDYSKYKQKYLVRHFKRTIANDITSFGSGSRQSHNCRLEKFMILIVSILTKFLISEDLSCELSFSVLVSNLWQTHFVALS